MVLRRLDRQPPIIMRKPKITWVVAVSVLACCAGCSSDNEPQTTTSSTESAETTKISPQVASPERSPGPETEEEIKARLNQLPAYEDRTEPYPGRVWLEDMKEMFPADIRERHQYLFHVPIPQYVVGLRGNYRHDERGMRSSSWRFNIPHEHLEDFKRHLIEDMGVPEKALYEGYHAGSHSEWDKRDMDPRDTEFKELLEKQWADADGGLRFLSSSLTQADNESLPIAKGSSVLNFENHADPQTYPQLRVDLRSGQVVVIENPTYPD